MANSDTLLFIPDISGFTTFINETEVSHSKHIISELLQVIQENNYLDLELAEIEGDALFYYKKKGIPAMEKVIAMATEMFIAFHHQLLLYSDRRICNCGACSTAINLSLKFVVHFGQSELIEVGDKTKPFGSDVVIAHRLLKNSIGSDEYILLTDSAYEKVKKKPEELVFRQSYESYKDIGKIGIVYTNISGMKDRVPPLPEMAKSFKSRKPVVVEGSIENDPKTVYELISNFEFRELWNKRTQKLEYRKNRVNRSGEKHICVIDGKNIEFETVTDDFGNDTWVYGEVTKDIPILKAFTNYYILKKIGEKTLLRIEAHPKSIPVVGLILTPIFRKMIKRELDYSIKSIQKAAKQEALQYA